MTINWHISKWERVWETNRVLWHGNTLGDGIYWNFIQQPFHVHWTCAQGIYCFIPKTVKVKKMVYFYGTIMRRKTILKNWKITRITRLGRHKHQFTLTWIFEELILLLTTKHVRLIIWWDAWEDSKIPWPFLSQKNVNQTQVHRCPTGAPGRTQAQPCCRPQFRQGSTLQNQELDKRPSQRCHKPRRSWCRRWSMAPYDRLD